MRQFVNYVWLVGYFGKINFVFCLCVYDQLYFLSKGILVSLSFRGNLVNR